MCLLGLMWNKINFTGTKIIEESNNKKISKILHILPILKKLSGYIFNFNYISIIINKMRYQLIWLINGKKSTWKINLSFSN